MNSVCLFLHSRNGYYCLLFVFLLNVVPYLPEWKMTRSKTTPQVTHICQGKMSLLKSQDLPKTKCLLKTFYCYLRTLNTQNMSHSMYLYHSVSLSPSSQSGPSPSSHSLLTFHHISSAVPSTALDIQHFLKPFKVTCGEMHCHAVMIHND
jgi:hypothetical protein